MITFIYDQSFEGLLCSVFEAYEQKIKPGNLLSENTPPTLFSERQVKITTDSNKARRVWKGLQKKISPAALPSIPMAWQSELPGSDWLLFQYIYKVFKTPDSIELNFGDPIVLKVVQIAKKVHRERHRVIQFLRFQKMADGTFFAATEPLYNVLPFTIEHLKNRFAGQTWIIYDMKRNYGYYYDQRQVKEVCFQQESPVLQNNQPEQHLMDREELLFQKMWQEYFKTTCIKERINPKLHRQNLPVRFWKYLPEKNIK